MALRIWSTNLCPHIINSTTPVWLAALNTLGPTFHQAYEIASQSEIDRLSKKVPRNWGAPAASPATPIIPAAMLEKEKTIILDEHQHAVNNWTVFEFLRPIHLQHQLTQQHRRNVHQAAYIIMKDATTLRGAQFDKAYTATFARMAFLPECRKSNFFLHFPAVFSHGILIMHTQYRMLTRI